MAQPRSYKVLSETARVCYRSNYIFLPSSPMTIYASLLLIPLYNLLLLSFTVLECLFLPAYFSLLQSFSITFFCLLADFPAPNLCILFSSIIVFWPLTPEMLLLLKNALFLCRSYGYREPIFITDAKIVVKKSAQSMALHFSPTHGFTIWSYRLLRRCDVWQHVRPCRWKRSDVLCVTCSSS